MTDDRAFTVAAALYFTSEPADPRRPDGARKTSPFGGGQSAGWTVFGFATLADAEAFASRTTIFGRQFGNRIGGPGADSSRFNAAPR